MFLVKGTFLFGQEEGFIRGEVIDKKTGEPIVFATIRLSDKAVGVISNQDGSFRIPRKFKELGNSLVISCIGFQNKELYISDLSVTSTNRIFLNPEALELSEAVVQGKRKREPSPRQIIKRAIERIPENYPSKPFSTVGYYRDYQLKENEYVNLNEAILNIVDLGFQHNDFYSTRVQIYKYLKNTSFPRDSFAARNYDYAGRSKIIENAFLDDFGGNEFNILRIHDAIRNYETKTYSFVNRFNKDLLRNHSFLRERDISFNGERMFVLALDKSKPELVLDEFSKDDARPSFIAKGKMYISRATYAIHKFVYELYDNNANLRDKKNEASRNEKMLFEVNVEYTSKEGKMFPNYISFHNLFKFQKANFRVEDIDFDLDQERFVVTFNNPPTYLSANQKGNYRVEYKNKKLKLRAIEQVANKVFLQLNSKAFDGIKEELIAIYEKNNQLPFKDFWFSFGNVTDSSGNFVNDLRYEKVNQFREFFVQEINIDFKESAEDKFMDKRRPIFENQPIDRPVDFDEYWMNTPFKSVEN